MTHHRSGSVATAAIIAALAWALAAGCGDDDSPTGPGKVGPQPELFPGVTEEMWYFFKPDSTLDHYERTTFTYAVGKRVSGEWYSSGFGMSANVAYEYDEQGRLLRENWTAPALGASWSVTVRYNEQGTRVLGGDAPGMSSVVYGFDDRGRRVTTNMTLMNPPSSFVLTHHYDEQGRVFLGTGRTPDGMRIVVRYTY
ncbi:MAG: hypothetical protein AB1505_29780 [Candidatus Latescibacterota bacterium]